MAGVQSIRSFYHGKASGQENMVPRGLLSLKTVDLLRESYSVADPDPGSGAFLDPGSGMGKKSGSGSGMTNSKHAFACR
jgi:hypothetical protein